MDSQLAHHPGVGADTYSSPCPIEPSAAPAGPLTPLKTRLRQDNFVRLMFEMDRRYPGAHLKLLRADELTDRRRTRIAGRQLWNFSSDSFLGLDRDARVQSAIAEALPRWGTHNGVSPAFCSVALCREAERRLARWLGVEDTLIFPSVTLANIGLLPGIAMPGTLLVVDRKAHESVHQGVTLAASNRGVSVSDLSPCTPDALGRLLDEETHDFCVVATDGVYSMTGASPPLLELDRVARKHGGVLYVDDAHGTGVYGPRGRGAAAAALGGLGNALVVGSLSKAFSCLGAFVTCDPELKLFLQMRSSTAIFGGPVPPPYLAGIIAACDIIDSPEGDGLRTRLRRLAARLTDGIRTLGLAVHGSGDSPIVSIRVGDIGNALRAGRWLFDRGFHVQSVHYPGVPARGSLLRIQVNANHPDEAIDELLNALADLKAAFHLPQ
jgi:glycine C-acetyltransferase